MLESQPCHTALLCDLGQASLSVKPNSYFLEFGPCYTIYIHSLYVVSIFFFFFLVIWFGFLAGGSGIKWYLLKCEIWKEDE